jgi:hypothetical protein
VNTKPCYVRSQFHSPSEPGLNIFDFEASFGLYRMINRADITVLFNGLRIKIGKSAEYLSQIKHERGELHFEGEIQQRSRYFDFNIQRKIAIYLNSEKIRGIDTAQASVPFQAFPRFVFDRQTIIKEIHSRSALITHGNSKYILSIYQRSQDCELIIGRNRNNDYPTAEICYSALDMYDVKIAWAIEATL